VALYAFNNDGRVQWSWAIPGQTQSSEPVSGDFNPSIIGDGHVLVSSASQLTAIGSVPEKLWTTSFGILVSAGRWSVGYDGKAAYVLDLRTGKPAGRLRAPNGNDVIPIMPFAGQGLLAMDRDNATALNLVMLDPCGGARWSLRIPGSKVCTGLSVVGPGEVIYLGIGSCNGGEPSPEIIGIGPDGRIVSGPIPSTTLAPWVAGADGVVYAVELGALTPPSKLVAFSPALTMLWTLDLPGVLSWDAGAILTDEGVLYAQMNTDAGNTVIAVQTGSPGLAASSWPTRRHDNRSSNWIPGPP
jgi:hypothetical protein